ncbi:MAG: SMR family transporter [Candidatus Nealsonbacteria bacterium]|nr:SMR family transporter [Candidatus Nealsonbacteria bacterium]
MYQTYLILLVSVLSTVAAQLCLKKGVLALGSMNLSINSFLGLIPRIFQNIWLLGGLFLYGISFILWLFVISKIKLNTAYPIATSLNFSLVVIFSWLFLKEQMLPVQILGIAVIVFGIFLLLKP